MNDHDPSPMHEETLPEGTQTGRAASDAHLIVKLCIQAAAGLNAAGRAAFTILNEAGTVTHYNFTQTLVLDPWSAQNGGAWDTLIVPVPAGYRGQIDKVVGAVQIIEFRLI
jgi:hypothetical protein